VSYILPIRQQ